MAINTNLLIAAPMLQDLLVDKDGRPMAAGTITMYQDNSRTTLKNWYYQTGTPGNYTYITLPNPLTLSAAGTISDANGVDTIPFYYPFSELDETVSQPYYVTIVNFAQTNQITRANFPFNRQGSSGPTLNNSFDNLIVNNGFWRNFLPNSINTSPASSITLSNGSTSTFLTSQTVSIGTNTTLYTGTVAPSQHDGFSFPDIEFIKNNLTATETCTFTPFPFANKLLINTPNQTNTPEYYISHACTGAGSGETYKCYQFPIALHLNNLSNVNYTVSIQAQNGGAAGVGGVINLSILQFTGTGTTSPAPTIIQSVPLTLTTSWAVYSLSDIFPSSTTISNSGDDAFYLQVTMPLNTPCNINFTKPSLYLTNNVLPNFDLETYDQVNAIISSPRTGDIRSSINSFYPYGWVPMNDGVIGLDAKSVVSTATIPGYVRGNFETWQLFNLIWNLAKPYDSGSTFNPIAQMYTNNGTILTAANYGTTAYGDFNANNAIALTKMFGRVLMGTVPASALNKLYNPQNQTVTITSSSGIVVTPTSITPFWIGAPVTFSFTAGGSLPGNIVATAIYYVTNISATTFQIATTYANALAGTPVVAYSSAGSNVVVNFDPTGIPVGEYGHTQLTNELASHTHGIGSGGQFFTNQGGSFTFTNAGGISIKGIANTDPTPAALSQVPFNITQPGTFYNIFIKL